MNTLTKNTGISIFTQGENVSSRVRESVKSVLKAAGIRQLSGPEAVERNLLLGLQKIGVKFNLNPPADELYANVSILRSPNALINVKGLSASKVIVGPNFSAQDMAKAFKAYPEIKFFLSASESGKKTYEYYGVPADKIRNWAVGIDAENFPDVSNSAKTTDALLYFKRRKKEELSEAIELLKKTGQSYALVEYGKYNEQDFKTALGKCRYAVILDGTESQGIAIEEIMSSNLPLFVFDQIFLGDSPVEELKDSLNVSSVPYWGEKCGIKVPTDTFGQSKNFYISITEAGGKFKEFLSRLSEFRPREFVAENLSLEKQAREFCELFEI